MAQREIITFDEALSRVLGAAGAPGVESVGLHEARGRVLYADVHAESAFPLADNSAMDGFGVRAAEVAAGAELRLVGDALAGRPFEGALPEGCCVRVMTGGLIPEGADAVVPVEHTSGYEPLESGGIRFDAACEPGANIRMRGCVRDEGELLLEGGSEVTPAVIGVLAQQGITEVPVAIRPRVAVLATGDEVIPIDQEPQPGQVRNSNAWALAAQIESCGGLASQLPVLGDDEDDTRERLRAALSGHELVCTIGGVSVGTKDLVRGAFEALGGETLVESVKIKPGKPTYFGRVELEGRSRFLLGLPGNPASSFSIFALLGVPLCRAMQGLDVSPWQQRAKGLLRESNTKKNWRLQALGGRLLHGAEGVEVEHVPEVNSGDLFYLADADVLFFAPEGEAPQDGDRVEWIPLQ
jgi:molybdopterin molybdotransferase